MVIGNLIDTLKSQNYPEELLDVYVLPNNCTDNTEEVSLEHGAKVFHCSSKVHSKGAALEEFFDDTFANNDVYDAFCIFDADNLVDPGFFIAMNNAMCSGETIAQGYRDSKNPADSWISGCQSIFYWTLNRFGIWPVIPSAWSGPPRRHGLHGRSQHPQGRRLPHLQP